MIDLALLRDNPEIVRRSQAARGNDQSTVDVALEADRSRRAALSAFEELRAEQNAFGKLVAKAPKEEKAALVAQAKDLAERVKQAQHAANEAAVGAFRAGRLGFLGIVETIERVVDAHEPPDALTVESLAEAEAWARATADRMIAAQS